MTQWYALFLTLVTAGMIGCGSSVGSKTIPADAKTLLEQAERFELYSLDPDPSKRDESSPNAFQRWKVLGSTTILNADTRKALVTALKKGVEENQGMVAACFNPRHGIRVTKGDKTADFVICFECYRAQVYFEKEKAQGFLVTRSPEPEFNRVLSTTALVTAWFRSGYHFHRVPTRQ